jgi:predicted nucleic-acid-binding protein
MQRKPVGLDTNAVIHYIAVENVVCFNKISNLLIETDCFVPMEVISEAVFVLENVIGMKRQLIADRMKEFINLQDNLVAEINVAIYALNLFASSKLDFVDCLLDGYAKVNGNPVFTFDGDLKKQLEHKFYHA